MIWHCKKCGIELEGMSCPQCGRLRIGNKEDKIKTLKTYLIMKIEECDWHAVSDAANDLRVLEGK